MHVLFNRLFSMGSDKVDRVGCNSARDPKILQNFLQLLQNDVVLERGKKQKKNRVPFPSPVVHRLSLFLLPLFPPPHQTLHCLEQTRIQKAQKHQQQQHIHHQNNHPSLRGPIQSQSRVPTLTPIRVLHSRCIRREMTLLAGDSPAEANSKTKAKSPQTSKLMVLRREHVSGNKLYTTKTDVGGKHREISIDFCRAGDDSRLYFSVDNKRMLKIKHLKWKFRGKERIEVDGDMGYT